MNSTIEEGITKVKDLIGDATSNITNPFAGSPVASAIGGAVTGGVVGAGAIYGISKLSKKRKKHKTKNKRSRKRNTKHYRRRKRKTPRTAGKGKDRSSKRIRYTKKGQPYIIKRNGRAMFIKKGSARRSHKLKGGRY